MSWMPEKAAGAAIATGFRPKPHQSERYRHRPKHGACPKHDRKALL